MVEAGKTKWNWWKCGNWELVISCIKVIQEKEESRISSVGIRQNGGTSNAERVW